MHHRHDKLFRYLFGQPSRAALLLRLALSPAVAEYLDMAHLTPTVSNIIDQYLAEHRPDLVYQSALAGRSAYAIIEHQSTEHCCMPARFLDAMCALLLEHTANHPDAPMPVFLPILVYQGGKDGPWRAPRRLSECYSLPPHTARAVASFLDVEPTLLDLSTFSDDDLRDAELGPVPTLGLWTLARVRFSADLLDDLNSVIDLVAAAYRAPEDRASLHAILEYIFMHAQETQSHAIERIFDMSLPQVEHEPPMTIWDVVVTQSRDDGRRDLLRKLLEQRFGTLPPEVREHLDRIGPDEIEAMALRVLSVATLEDAVAQRA